MTSRTSDICSFFNIIYKSVIKKIKLVDDLNYKRLNKNNKIKYYIAEIKYKFIKILFIRYNILIIKIQYLKHLYKYFFVYYFWSKL